MSADLENGSKSKVAIQNEAQNSTINRKPLPKIDNPSHRAESEEPKMGYNFKEVCFSQTMWKYQELRFYVKSILGFLSRISKTAILAVS